MDFEQLQPLSVEAILDRSDFQAWAQQHSPEELLQLQQQFPQLSPKVNEALQLYKAMTQFGAVTPKQFQPEAAFAKQLKQNMQQAAHRKRRLLWLRMAAAAAVLLLFGIGLWMQSDQAGDQAARRWQTAFGEWQTITLPDGSTVRLNANSTLDWLGGEARALRLEGEAFFDVVHNARPFTVQTDELQVAVMGTRFNVNTRDEQTAVFLEEGRVNVLLGQDQIEMQPDDFFEYSKVASTLKAPVKTEAIHHSSWKEGVLTLQAQPLRKVFDEVEAIYGLTIVGTSDEQLEDLKTVAFPIDDLPTTIRILENVLDLSIQQEGQQLIIEL